MCYQAKRSFKCIGLSRASVDEHDKLDTGKMYARFIGYKQTDETRTLRAISFDVQTCTDTSPG